MGELTTSTGVNENSDPVDQIADLLAGEEVDKEEDEGAESANLESDLGDEGEDEGQERPAGSGRGGQGAGGARESADRRADEAGRDSG